EPLQVEMLDEEDNDEEMQQEVHEDEDMLEAQSEPNEEAGVRLKFRLSKIHLWVNRIQTFF
ncbi:hypothetical protein A2U01_0076494, partial [Trifolium medium]|nr:hypothetical protein [Trifolium medium]